MSTISRRQLVQGAGALGLGLLTGCGRLPGQAPPPAATMHQIAVLLGGISPEAPAADFPSAIRQGLSEFGYIEGENILIDQRNAAGEEQLEAAAELVRRQPAVIMMPGVNDVRAVLAATTTIPIVSGGNGDLVATGLVASQARPGGNVTGLSTPVLFGKQLQLLQEAVPTLSRVAVLFDSHTAGPPREAFVTAAGALGLQVQFVGMGGAEDIAPALDAAVWDHADGLFVVTAPALSAYQPQIAALAVRRGIPSMWQSTEAASHGGLAAYGPNRRAMYRRAGYFVDRILKGASPGELPIEQPREFDFVINLRTAQALGLTIPQHVLLQATELIQ